MDKAEELFTSRVYRRSRSNYSVHTYRAAVKLFMDFLNVEGFDELAALLRFGELDVVESLNRWLDELDRVEKSPQTKVTYYRHA